MQPGCASGAALLRLGPAPRSRSSSVLILYGRPSSCPGFSPTTGSRLSVVTKCWHSLSLVYSVGDILACCPGLRQGPFSTLGPRGTVGIPQRAVGAGLAGPCSCGPGPQCPLQAARLSPSSGHLPAGPGASAEGKVGGLGKHRSPACGSEWDWVHRRGRVGGRKAPPCAQNLFYAP